MTASPAPPTDARSGVPTARAAGRILRWFLLTVAVLVVVAAFVCRSVLALIDQGRWVDHTHEVLAVLQDTSAQVRDAESAQRGYLLAGQPEYLAAYHAALAGVPQHLDRLRRLTADNPGQQTRLDQLGARVEERLASLDSVLRTYERDGLAPAQEEVRAGTGRQQMNDMLATVREIEAEERRLLEDRQRATEAAARTTLVVGGACFAACLGVLACVFGLMRREWSRRRQTEASLQRANTRLEESLRDLRELTREAALVASLGDYLQACRTPAEAYGILAQTVPHLLPGVAGAVGITSHSRTLVETVLTWGGGERFAPAFHPDACWGLRRGRPHHVGGGCDPACGHLTPAPAGYLCLPMAVHGETLGVLSLSTDRPGGLAEQERHAARAVAEQVALALANLRLQEALRDQSIRDPLTGLFNRRYMEESLGREVARARRAGQPVAVVMADVDHFKRLNDTHGHEAGDAVLGEVGKLLARHVRQEDVACRYGGEEFCLILPGADLEAARQRAEEVREAVARLDVRHGPGGVGPITLSAGVAAYPACPEGAVIAAADAALYRAKREGRNRVAVADEHRSAADRLKGACPGAQPGPGLPPADRNGTGVSSCENS